MYRTCMIEAVVAQVDHNEMQYPENAAQVGVERLATILALPFPPQVVDQDGPPTGDLLAVADVGKRQTVRQFAQCFSCDDQALAR